MIAFCLLFCLLSLFVALLVTVGWSFYQSVRQSILRTIHPSRSAENTRQGDETYVIAPSHPYATDAVYVTCFVQGSLRLVLNTQLWSGMTVDRANSKSIRLTCLDEEGIPRIYLIQVNFSCYYTFFFCKHAVYKHARLRLLKN